MSFTTANKNGIFVCIAAIVLPVFACALMFLRGDLNILLLIGGVGIAALLAIAVLAPEAFILILLATKPFIDLTWNNPLFSFGGFSASALHITGVFVFIVAGYLYFFRNDGRAIFNEHLIWLFLLLNVFTGFVAVRFYEFRLMDVADTIIKLFDAYFIYFVAHRFMQDETSRLRIIGIIWITTLIVGILSVVQYSTGTFEIDISQHVERFAGLYNDPGTPSYNAIISLVFGSLYIEILKKKQRQLPRKVSTAFILTVLVTAMIMKITITKSAILMLIVFLVMWLGLYKRKLHIVIAILVIGSLFVYVTSEALRMRVAPELEFIAKSGRSMEQARSIGTGRVAVWERLLIKYDEEYDPLQKLFGNSQTYGAHNQYIAYLMQIGLVGLTVFLVIVLRFYRQLTHIFRVTGQPDVYTAMVLLWLFLIYGITGHPFYYTTLLWYLMIMLSLTDIYDHRITSKMTRF